MSLLLNSLYFGKRNSQLSGKYKNSFITAIDLSVKSLTYAKRKAEELEMV